MAASQSGFDMDQYEAELDSPLAGVMPDTWLGHARLAITEYNFSKNDKQRILRGTRKLLDKHDDLTAREAAKACINALDD